MKIKITCILIFSFFPGSGYIFPGQINGTVKFKSLPVKIQAFNPYQFGQGVKAGQMESPVENVVVYIADHSLDKYTTIASKETKQIIQKDQIFIPHVLPIVVGAEVDFPNFDPFYHNVFSLSKVKVFDLGRYPTGKSKRIKFDKPGIGKIYCEIHSDMSAIILILENPFFIKPDKNGKYAMSNVPPGSYTLIAWSEDFKPISRKVDVPEIGIIYIDFAFD